MNGLRLFARDSGGGWILVSWHSPHSLTWRWFLSFTRFRGDEARVWPICWSYQTNPGGLQWGFRIPWLGVVAFHQQRPMWYRDLYIRMRDERDHARYKQSETVSPPPVPPIKIDGGMSLH